VRVGSVLALKGPAQGLGTGMKTGMDAAFKGAKVGARNIQLVAENDFYEPEKAAEETRKLLKAGIFAMIGNVCTPTAARRWASSLAPGCCGRGAEDPW
jgi:ABC-type branched-subunit amino acid transport system substrate-binding protein